MVYSQVQFGIDVLADKDFLPIRGMKVGLCTNISSCTTSLEPTITLFTKQKNFKLKAVFAPEHGFYGALQDQVRAKTFYDRKRRVRIYSLYSKYLVPDQAVLKTIDALVIDLQDIGARYYTFVWSAVMLIEQMGDLGKKVFILDRPNPLNGEKVQGPVLEPDFVSFVGLYPVPVRHGFTIGELCSFVNSELKLDADITVIKMKGWTRDLLFNDTGLCWTMPTPNMPDFSTALVYPGMCLLEGTNISEGRGTTKPFEVFGAPWIDPFTLVKKLNQKKIPGIRFRPVFYMPTFNKYKGRLCGGAQVYVTNDRRYDPFSMGLEIIQVIRTLYPDKFKWRKPPYEHEKDKMPFEILAGNSWIKEYMEKNQPVSSIRQRWQMDLYRFKRKRRKYLLY
jgi:uncharacterized protein YbbC (DUF1343 family)